MGLDRDLTHIKVLGDLALAHALGHQLEDSKLVARDAEVISSSLVRDEWLPGRDQFCDSDPGKAILAEPL